MKTSRTSLILASGAIAVAALVLAALAAVGAGTPAQAQTAARIESQTRPNFGLLLDPAAGRNTYRREHRRFDYGDRRLPPPPPYGAPGYGPPPPINQNAVTVDCGGNPGSGAVEAAVRRVAPGGTLTIRATGGACVGWLNIDKPMTVRGSGGYGGSVVLQAPAGLPCITVAPGVRAVIEDLSVASPSAGDAPCVGSEGGQVIMNRVSVRYVGNESAFLIRGGLLDIRSARIDADTQYPAILVEAGTLTAIGVSVVNAQSGVEISPGPEAPSRLEAVYLTGEHNPSNFGPRAIGVNVRSRREIGEIQILNSRICGYNEGVAVDGVRVTMENSRVCLADKGLVVYGGELTLTGSRVRSRYVGVVAQAGRAVVTNTAFSGMDEVFYSERGGDIDADHNSLWSRGRACQPEYREVYRGRYQPIWASRDGDGFTCRQTPYPRSWWSEDEGSMGVAYADDAFILPGWDRYNAGCGWYTRLGDFVDDDRFYGETRWGRRNPPLPFARDPRYDRRWVRDQERLREQACRSRGAPLPNPY